MKEFWLEIEETLSTKAKDDLIQASSQLFDVLLIEEKELSSKLGKTQIKICSKDELSDICIVDPFDENRLIGLKKSGKKVAVKATIKKKEDEETVAKAVDSSSDYIILSCPNWKIIPLENVIAKVHGKCRLLAEVSSSKEADIALKTLELGADGVVLKTSSLDEIIETSAAIKNTPLKIDLTEAEIVGTKAIGMGARVCIDTCDLMKMGEGMLVGSQSSALFLVESETHESPFVETRPFRVNAGPVSLYVLSSSGKTKYLSELKAGDEVTIVDRNGNSRGTNIARVKIELRPLILIEAKKNGKVIKTIAQNAETIRLVTVKKSKPVTDLKKGDNICVRLEKGGRHFGVKVEEETVIER